MFEGKQKHWIRVSGGKEQEMRVMKLHRENNYIWPCQNFYLNPE